MPESNLNNLLKISGEKIDGSIEDDTGLQALFNSEDNTIINMFGSYPIISKIGTTTISIYSPGNYRWRKSDTQYVKVRITKEQIKTYKECGNGITNFKLYL